MFRHFLVQVLENAYVFALHQGENVETRLVLILLVVVLYHEGIDVSETDSILVIDRGVIQQLVTNLQQFSRVILSRDELFQEELFLLQSLEFLTLARVRGVR